MGKRQRTGEKPNLCALGSTRSALSKSVSSLTLEVALYYPAPNRLSIVHPACFKFPRSPQKQCHGAHPDVCSFEEVAHMLHDTLMCLIMSSSRVRRARTTKLCNSISNYAIIRGLCV